MNEETTPMPTIRSYVLSRFADFMKNRHPGKNYDELVQYALDQIEKQGVTDERLALIHVIFSAEYSAWYQNGGLVELTYASTGGGARSFSKRFKERKIRECDKVAIGYVLNACEGNFLKRCWKHLLWLVGGNGGVRPRTYRWLRQKTYLMRNNWA